MQAEKQAKIESKLYISRLQWSRIYFLFRLSQTVTVSDIEIMIDFPRGVKILNL